MQETLPRSGQASPDRTSALGRPGTILLALSLVSGLVTHAYNLLQYPLFLTDEGIYVSQAWSVLRQGQLSPYTYFYDHAPGGWLAMAAWANLLPNQFQTFGNEIGTIRVLMLLVHVASTGLLFGIVRRISGSLAGAFLATFVFNLSPLAIYYQRMVLLDNLMVLWLLLAVYLLIRPERRVLTAVVAGLAFGLAVITKENAVFFAPALAYLVYLRARGSTNRRFMTSFWWFALLTPVTGYLLFAQLKSELIPAGLSFDLDAPPANRVSLVYTVWWQLNRTVPGGRSLFLDLMSGSWLPRDPYLLIGGGVAVLAVLWLWWRDRAGRPWHLAAVLLALGYAFYLARGSVLLDFYLTPMVPVLALNLGVAFGHLVRLVPGRLAVATTSAVVAAALLVPGAYLFKFNTEGELATQDLYHIRHTELQEQQIAYVRANIPPSARIIIDDDIWTALHDREPYYPMAHSHWKASSDPDVRDLLFRSDGQNIDYVVMSNRMREAMEGNNGDGRESWILEAIDQNGQLIWEAGVGDVHLEIYQIGS
jgi:4-amino-4-deoxy-L-arabinose transferase-like glycosyltransferase